MPIHGAEKPRVFGPDLIRATAIVLVLFCHTFPGGTMFPVIGVVRDYWGVWGVELFFLLSGYLIGGILMAELHAGRLDSVGGVFAFWRRRWFRTLPNYYFFFGLILLQARLELGHFPPNWQRFLWFGQALFTVHPGFFMAAWSLAIEEWFYLLFPLVLLLLSRLIQRRERAVLAAIAIFLLAPVIARGFLSPDLDWLSAVRESTLPRLDAITYGVLLAYLKNHCPHVWNSLASRWPLGVLAAVGLFLQACVHDILFGHISSASFFYRVFYFCLISLSLALLYPKIVGLPSPTGWWATVVRKLSLWSYSIYLSHILFLGLIMAFFRFMGWFMVPGGIGLILRDVLTWLTAIPFSAFVFHYFEKPCMDLRDQSWRSLLSRFRVGNVRSSGPVGE